MANICDYKMMVRGSKKNIEILKALMSEDMDKAKKLGYNGKNFLLVCFTNQIYW